MFLAGGEHRELVN